MNRTLTFFVPGTPRPAGSKRAIPFERKGGGLGVNVIDASGKKGKDWRASVKWFAVEAHEKKFGPASLWRGPIGVVFIFRFARPKSHFRSGKNADKLKPNAPLWHIQDPDALKIARAVEDALTGAIWQDDNQIVHEVVWKYWASPNDPPGARITIAEIGEGDAQE